MPKLSERQKPTEPPAEPEIKSEASSAEVVQAEADATNEWLITAGENLSNHSASLRGQGKYVAITRTDLLLRTKQQVFRLIAWLLVLAEANGLPDEDVASTLDEVIDAVERT